MRGYLKLTSIHGYNTLDPGPPPGEARLEWGKTHSKHLQYRGHWRADACLRAARRAGIVTDIEVQQVTCDVNGKGYGSIDHRFRMSESGVIAVPVSAAENAAWAPQQSDDVWDMDRSD